jgi:nucleoside-diphosphate-sugar epimerase
MSDKKTILVTGANGLLGRYLLHSLQSSQQYDVEALVHLQPSAPIPGVSYHIIDLSSDWSTDNLPPKVDAVIHLAQSAHFRDFPAKALDVFAVNVASTARLLDYAYRAGARQFLYASSGGVYGSGKQVFRENSAIGDPGLLGYYLGSKLSGETLAQSYAAHMQVVILRFFFMYGTGQNRSMLIPRLIDSVKDGKSITLVGKEGLRINPVHVSDAAAAVTAVLKTKESAIYNVAGDETVSLKELCRKIEVLVGQEARFVESEGESMDIVADIAVMKQHLHKPIVHLETGLKDLL